MTIDLSQFHQVFYEESYEGLDVMESNLMALDPGNIDHETINAIFRAAHSIKGGSATFGFSSISEFTHDLETILDQVRSGERLFRGEDVNLCLKAVDCMREMLQLLQSGDDGYTEASQALKKKFADMLNGDAGTETDSADSVTTAVGIPEANRQPELTGRAWKIHFAPSLDILKTGNDVVRMFRELAELGKITDIKCQRQLPAFKSLDPENCYLAWDLLLESEAERTLIEEVFEWVADESDLQIDSADLPAEQHSQAAFSKQAASAGNDWYIRFKPDKDILRTGNEPTRLFATLQEFGELTATCHCEHLPSLKLIDHETCQLWWDLRLHSASASEADIQEVFEWVIDESELIIGREPVSGTQTLQGEAATTQAIAEGADIVPIGGKAHENAGPTEQAMQTSPPGVPAAAAAAAKRSAAGKKATAETGSIRVGIDKVDNLINMVGELVITQSMLGQLGTDFDVERIPKLLEGLGQLEQNTRELQESVMQIRMLPISFAFSRFPRMVRDLSQSLGKELNLEMLGEQTELDKTVMEKIGDPLVHLVRNAVDHGIEMPDERIAKGKPSTGQITLNAYHQGGNVVIEIADDGRGLDRDKLVRKATEKNLITPAEAEQLANEQVFDLIFQPGFSTATEVSDLSGRGVGMDVVKRNIQALNGIVEIKSEQDKGSTITIRLPLTLAILDGQLVRVGANTYIFPLVSIIESLHCRRDFISKVAGGCDVFKLRDDYVPIIELHRTFAVEPDTTDLEQSLIVVVECDGNKVGIVVDELLAQQQVVIKSLEQNYKRVDGISGATILGDGTVALILDIVGIVRLAGEKFSLKVTENQTISIASNISKLAS